MTAEADRSVCKRQLVLENALSELDRLAEFVREIGHDEGLDADRAFALQLCLEEAAVNVIVYGKPEGATPKRITVTLMRGAPCVTVSIEDNCMPFDPTCVPAPPVPASLESAPIGGQGIHLIRSFASEMHYERAGGCNRLTLTFAPRVDAEANV